MKNRRLTNAVVALTLVFSAAVAVLLWPESEPRELIAKPLGFGRIQRTSMAERRPPGYLGRIPEQIRILVRLPKRPRAAQRYLHVGSAQLEWSLKDQSRRTGWLSFFDPISNQPVWAFAPCSRSNLLEIATEDMPARFITFGDSSDLFHPDAPFLTNTGHKTEKAISVREGQILFARHIGNSNQVFAVRFAEQGGDAYHGQITVEFVGIDVDKAEPDGAANGSQPIRSETNSTSSPARSNR